MNFSSDGNIRAFKFGFYIAGAIIALGIYNFIIKTYFDPCCQEHTVGEGMLGISKFLSYLIGIAIFVLIIFIFIKIIINQFKPQVKISWKAKKESVFNLFFMIILIINFCLLLGAQLPVVLIGCTICDPISNIDSVKNHMRL